MHWPSLLELLAIAVSGTAAGFVNTLAGAGSLLTLPVLLALGLPTDEANATNRVGVFLAALTGMQGFDADGKLDRAAIVGLAVPTLLGAVLGAYLAVVLPESVFRPVVLTLLVLVSVTLVWKPDVVVPAEGTTPIALRERPLAVVLLVLLGAYAAFLQAGMGILATLLLSGMLRYDLVRASALKAGLVVAITTVALAIFLAHGKVRFVPGLALGVFQVIGARLAVRWAKTAQPKALRWVLLAAALVSIGVAVVKG
jgi:uncharacterized membrane protein YfcA